MTELVLAGALLVVSVFFAWREVHHTRVEGDLLNRLMARDLPEYRAMTAPRTDSKRSRNILVNNAVRGEGGG